MKPYDKYPPGPVEAWSLRLIFSDVHIDLPYTPLVFEIPFAPVKYLMI